MNRFFSLLFSRFGMFASNGLMILLTARWLGASGRGEVSILLAAISISGLLAQVPAGIALVYWMPRFNHQRLFQIGLAAQFLLAFVLGLIMGPWFGLLGLLHHLVHLFRYFLLAFNRMEEDALVNVVQGVTQVLLFIGFHTLSIGKGWIQFAFAFAFSQIIGLVLSVYLFKKALKTRDLSLPEVSKPDLKKFFMQGAEVQGGNLLYLLMTRWLFFRLERVGTLAITGVFSVAIAAVEALLLAASSLAAILMNQIAQGQSSEKTKAQTISIARISFWLTTLGLLIIGVIPDYFWSWLLGVEYAPLANLLRLLSPSIAFLSLATVLLHSYSGLGRYRINLMVVSIALLVSLIAAPWIIKPDFELDGAGLVAALAYGSLAFATVIRFSIEYRTNWTVWLPNREMIKTFTQHVWNRRFFS